jgi:autotransporter translocation and assembly factor TamB
LPWPGLMLLEGNLETITQKCVDKAKEGDLMAAKLVLYKAIHNAKEGRLSVKLPKVKANNIAAVLSEVIAMVSKSEITPGEGRTLAAMLEGYQKAVEINDIAERLNAL